MRVAELSSTEKEGEGEHSERDSLASNLSHSSGGSGTAAGLGGEENLNLQTKKKKGGRRGDEQTQLLSCSY